MFGNHLSVIINWFLVLLVAAVISSISAFTGAATFSAGIERSQWYLSSSIFECALIHDIPHYGRGTFFHEAGEQMIFFLNAARNPMRAGQAALVIEAPKWRPGSEVRDLGYIAVREQARPVTVDNPIAVQMMEGLLAGMMPTFTRRARFNDDTVRVEISSINFSGFYEDYLNCVAGLLPVNFRQVERTKIFFKVDESVLNSDDMAALDRMILYAKADPSVTAIFIDGHTDITGRRIYNRRLSKDRAEAVNDYLLSHGIAEDLITVRYHGERYPVVNANSYQQHARNRRTTVRLERGTQPPLVEDDILPAEVFESAL